MQECREVQEWDEAWAWVSGGGRGMGGGGRAWVAAWDAEEGKAWAWELGVEEVLAELLLAKGALSFGPIG